MHICVNALGYYVYNIWICFDALVPVAIEEVLKDEANCILTRKTRYKYGNLRHLILQNPWWQINDYRLNLDLCYSAMNISVILAFYLCYEFVCQFCSCTDSHDMETSFRHSLLIITTGFSSEQCRQFMQCNWTRMAWCNFILTFWAKSMSYSFSVKGICTICNSWRSCFGFDMKGFAFYQHITKNVSRAFYTLC